MNSVKEVKVTDDFLTMNPEIRNCQELETFEDCTTRKYINKLENECHCVPYNLRDFSRTNQVVEPMHRVKDVFLDAKAFQNSV